MQAGIMQPAIREKSTPFSRTQSAAATRFAFVGYTPDRFIIRNSWGTGWGDKGFGYASAQYINDAFFNESYGVTL